MNVWSIDFWANNWDSAFHRASPISKVLSVAAIVSAVVVTNSFTVLLVVYLSVAAAIVFTRLPALKILSIGAYPAIFALLFAASRWNGNLLDPAVIILKALTAALAMLLLITTTSYPDIFATFQFILPTIVADGLFLAYRSLFILLALMGDLITALRLRGGLRKWHLIRNAKNLAFGLGLLFIRSLSLSERLYGAMRVRGYSGRLVSRSRWQKATEYDFLPFGLACWVLAIVVGLQLWPDLLQPYNGYFLLAAVLALMLAAAYARWPHESPIRGGSLWQK